MLTNQDKQIKTQKMNKYNIKIRQKRYAIKLSIEYWKFWTSNRIFILYYLFILLILWFESTIDNGAYFTQTIVLHCLCLFGKYAG